MERMVCTGALFATGLTLVAAVAASSACSDDDAQNLGPGASGGAAAGGAGGGGGPGGAGGGAGAAGGAGGGAGGGIVDQDPIDTEKLQLSTDEARRLLSASGRYSIVDTGSAEDELISAGGIQHCNGCESPLAEELGADQSMVGIITRVTRTEYTIQILVRDTETGAVMSNDFTGLRMGANYSWPRGVKSLMNKSILSVQPRE